MRAQHHDRHAARLLAVRCVSFFGSVFLISIVLHVCGRLPVSVAPSKTPTMLCDMTNTQTFPNQNKHRLDDLDIGFFPVTASEMKVKLKSRQATYQQTIDPAAQLADTDRFSFCAEINEKAFQWALKRAPARTRARFGDVGVWPVFDPDIRCVACAGTLVCAHVCMCVCVCVCVCASRWWGLSRVTRTVHMTPTTTVARSRLGPSGSTAPWSCRNATTRRSSSMYI